MHPMIERLLSNPESFILLLPLSGVLFLIYIALRRDFVVGKSQSWIFQINPVNWSEPTWTTPKIKAYYRHYGPLLLVSRQLYHDRYTDTVHVREPKKPITL